MTIHYRSQSPQILADFLSYHETIKAHSQRTVDEYYLDLRNFFRYIKQLRDPSLQGLPFDQRCFSCQKISHNSFFFQLFM